MNSANTEFEPSLAAIDGFPDRDRNEIARMYWAAFGPKLGVAIGPSDKAITLLSEMLNPASSIVARAGDGELLGVAGYKTPMGAFFSIDLKVLRRHFGLAGAVWRGVILSLLMRKPRAGTLLMDGIFVSERARGQGVGTFLLSAIKRKARALGCPSVRLDVIDTNPRARQLYEREGFHAVAVRRLGPFRHIFGFGSATTMIARSDQGS